MTDPNELEYVGFWLRVWASVIDTVLLLFIVMPLLNLALGRAYTGSGVDTFDLSGLDLGPGSADLLYAYAASASQGPFDFLVNVVLPVAAVIGFWLARQATPGKMAISARVVDAGTGGKISVGQAVGRYLGYFVSMFPCMLGLAWVGWDARKQGWHDKLAGTVVVRPRRRGTQDVVFSRRQP